MPCAAAEKGQTVSPGLWALSCGWAGRCHGLPTASGGADRAAPRPWRLPQRFWLATGAPAAVQGPFGCDLGLRFRRRRVLGAVARTAGGRRCLLQALGGVLEPWAGRDKVPYRGLAPAQTRLQPRERRRAPSGGDTGPSLKATAGRPLHVLPLAAPAVRNARERLRHGRCPWFCPSHRGRATPCRLAPQFSGTVLVLSD